MVSVATGTELAFRLAYPHLQQPPTLVERHTRYVMLVKVESKHTKSVVNALIEHAHKLPRELYKSLTWDRGKEMAAHQRFSLATDIDVFFCDPQRPWQRESNENTNGLLRQYFPKGMDLSGVHQNRLNAVARQLNERPRLTLDFRTPAECFNECVAYEPDARTGPRRVIRARLPLNQSTISPEAAIRFDLLRPAGKCP